jgi:hypothetical protein
LEEENIKTKNDAEMLIEGLKKEFENQLAIQALDTKVKD